MDSATPRYTETQISAGKNLFTSDCSFMFPKSTSA